MERYFRVCSYRTRVGIDDYCPLTAQHGECSLYMISIERTFVWGGDKVLNILLRSKCARVRSFSTIVRSHAV